MTTVLVTGGAGYIGSVLTEMLLDEGHEVRLLDRFFFGSDLIASLTSRKGLTVIKEDIRYAEPESFEGVDVVIHLAGISNDPACDLDPGISEAINLAGTMHVAKLAKGAGVSRFLFASSCSIYGEASGGASSEESPMAPVSLYARTKIEAEEQLLPLGSDGFAVTFLRNATVYGLSHRMRFDLVINIMTLYAYNTRKIYVLGGGRQWRPVVHVRDVCRAFIAVMGAPVDKVAGQAFNVGSNEQNHQIIGIAQMVRDVVPHTDIEVVPDDPDKRNYNVSFDKIGEVLGYRVEKTPYEGIVEIKQALERGVVEEDVRTKTVQYYRYLLEAERLIREVSYRGSIF